MGTSLPHEGQHADRTGLLDIEAVAERLGVGVRHVRRLVHEHRIPYIKWGHLLRFDPVEIEAWLDAARIPAREHGFPADAW